jgi:SAM-dependent methyltransferase
VPVAKDDALVATHKPELFDFATIDAAKGIIVTPEPGTTTDERWEKETRYLVDDIGQKLAIRPDACLLDFGCGVGRLAKELIERFGCRIIGIDSSKSMRLLAPDYVLSDRFLVWSPETLETMVGRGFRCDAAISLWVIQHVFSPPSVIEQIARTLRPGALFYALNQKVSSVPTDAGWVDDGFDVRSGLCQSFEELSFAALPEHVTTPEIAAASMIQLLRRRGI